MEKKETWVCWDLKTVQMGEKQDDCCLMIKREFQWKRNVREVWNTIQEVRVNHQIVQMKGMWESYRRDEEKDGKIREKWTEREKQELWER